LLELFIDLQGSITCTNNHDVVASKRAWRNDSNGEVLEIIEEVHARE